MGKAQKSVTVKLYPQEAEACEVIARLAGLDGKSGALREFMKSYIEAALVTIETGSPTKGTIKHIKNMHRFQKTMSAIQKNSAETMLYPEEIEAMKGALAI